MWSNVQSKKDTVDTRITLLNAVYGEFTKGSYINQPVGERERTLSFVLGARSFTPLLVDTTEVHVELAFFGGLISTSNFQPEVETLPSLGLP